MPSRTADRQQNRPWIGRVAAGASTVVLTVVLATLVWRLLGAPPAALAAPPPPPDTINEFIPENRNLGDCLGALQRPGCGSEASGGWRQGLIFLAMLGGLAVIGARIIVAARRRSRPSAGTDSAL